MRLASALIGLALLAPSAAQAGRVVD